MGISMISLVEDTIRFMIIGDGEEGWKRVGGGGKGLS